MHNYKGFLKLNESASQNKGEKKKDHFWQGKEQPNQCFTQELRFQE